MPLARYANQLRLLTVQTDTEMSIGAEFAMRWLDKNAPIKLSRGRSIDTVEFCKDVARAVDSHADKCRAEFDAVLRRVICEAVDDPTNSECQRIAAVDLLKSECMTFLASKISSGIDRPRRFPTNLNG